jgi:hypothetical protein
MGLFSRVDAPATVTDYVEPQNGASIDPEKATGIQVENGNTTPQQHHVHPDAERILVRKLDTRVTTLVAALCMMIELTLKGRD